MSAVEARLVHLRRQVRRTVAVFGFSVLLAGAIGVILVCGTLDWLLDLSAGVRLTLLVATGGGILYAANRFLLRPLTVPLSPLDMARRVEDRYPWLDDQLASAVAFLREPEHVAVGSAQLRQAVIEQAARRIDALDLEASLDRTVARRARWVAVATGVCAALLVVLSPATARIALARLINPLGNTRWPHQTHLVVVDPATRVARGDPFQVTVRVATGRVPDRAMIHYEFDGGDISAEPLRPVRGREFAGGLEAVQRGFDFYVRAGGTVSDAYHVEVVLPPDIQSLRARLEYPPYTGLPPEDLPPGKGHVRAVWGTKVNLLAHATKPIESAHIQRGNTRLPVALDPNGTELRSSFRLEDTGSYWFALRDREKLENRDATRYELKAINDQPPDVVVEAPVSDIEVTPNATVRLRVLAKDDYGLKDMALAFKRGETESATEQQVSLWTATDPTRRQVIEHGWLLAPLGLAVGTSVTYHVAARDGDDLRGPNVGKSRQLRLMVVSGEELARSLENRQFAIFQELQRLHKQQVETRGQVSELREALQKTGTLGKSDLDQWRAAEAAQRQINRRITSQGDGVQTQVAQMLASLTSNQIDNPALQEQLTGMQSTLQQVARDELPAIEQGLTRARKGTGGTGPSAAAAQSASRTAEGSESSQQAAASGRESRAAESSPPGAKSTPAEAKSAGTPPSQSAASKPATTKSTAANPDNNQPDAGKPSSQQTALAQVEEHQGNVVQSLEQMLERMSKWETYRAVARDAREVLDHQEQLAEQTRDVGKRTVGQSPQDLPAEDQAALSKLANRQAQVRDELNRLERKMDQMSERLADSDPAGAEALRQAAKNSRRAGTAEQMRQAASSIRDNQVGAADSAQQRSITDLKDLLDAIENNRENNLEKLVQKLKEAESQLADIKKRQLEQLERTQKADGEQDQAARKRELEELSRRQRELEKELAKLAQQIGRLNADRARQTASRAADRMGQAGSQLEQQQAGAAQQSEEKVLEELQKAQEELARARREAEAQLAMEQLRKIDGQLAALHTRQTAVKAETERLDAARMTNEGRWNRPLLGSLRKVTDEQAQVKKDTEALLPLLEKARVFALVLQRAATEMARARDRLDAQLADAETQSAEQAAADQFAKLLDALQNDAGGNQQGGGGSGGPPRDGIPPIAQLKMLRTLQVEINDRTDRLTETKAREGKLNTGQETELQSLSKEQGTLADIVRELIEALEASGGPAGEPQGEKL